MSVTVKQLTQKAGEHEVNRMAREQLEMIDHLLQTTTKVIGKNSLTVPLPVCFQGVTETNRDIIKTIVYSKILKSLEARSFIVNMIIEKNNDIVRNVKLSIEWSTHLDNMDIQRMSSYIQSKTRVVHIRQENTRSDNRNRREVIEDDSR